MNRNIIIAHRGASGEAPENTMPAFELAIAQAADCIELDVHFTKDKRIAVIHDESIDRTSNGRGQVCDMTLEQLREYDYSNNMAGYANVTLPELNDVFMLLQKNDILLNIELKNNLLAYTGLEEAVLSLADDYNVADKLIFSSFNHQSMALVRKLRPQSNCALLYSKNIAPNMAQYAQDLGVNGLHPHYKSLDAYNIDEANKRGMFINAWTVDDNHDITRLAGMGSIGIITNYPQRTRQTLGIDK